MEAFDRLLGGLVVSCQALDDEPLHGSVFMSRMARAGAQGGALGIIANGADDIAAIKADMDLPVIGVMTKAYADSSITLTPTMAEVGRIVDAGADIVALDATGRRRPQGESIDDFVIRIRKCYPRMPLIAEIATIEEAQRAMALGFDAISSAAYGYTESTVGQKLPDDDFAQLMALRRATAGHLLIAEGGLSVPAHAARAIELGADIVVVGSAITRPQSLARAFVQAMRQDRYHGVVPATDATHR